MLPRQTAAGMLALCGAGLLVVARIWVFTGDIERPGLVLGMSGGWRGAGVAVLGGILSLALARYLRRAP